VRGVKRDCVVVQVVLSWSERQVEGGVFVLLVISEVPASVETSSEAGVHEVFDLVCESFLFGYSLLLLPRVYWNLAVLAKPFATAPGTDLIMIDVKTSISDLSLELGKSFSENSGGIGVEVEIEEHNISSIGLLQERLVAIGLLDG
jgi:hypothetical protein